MCKIKLEHDARPPVYNLQWVAKTLHVFEIQRKERSQSRTRCCKYRHRGAFMWKLETGQMWQSGVKRRGHCQGRLSRLSVPCTTEAKAQKGTGKTCPGAVSLTEESIPSSIAVNTVG